MNSGDDCIRLYDFALKLTCGLLHKMIHLKEFWYPQLLIPSNSTALSLVSQDDSFWQLKIVEVSGKSIINESLFLNFYSAHIIFDRGRGRKLIKGYLLIDREYRFSFDREITSGSLILNVGSIPMAHYEAELVHELINKHGFTSDSLFCGSVLLVLVKNVDRSWLLIERWSLTSGETDVFLRPQSGFPNDIVILLGEWLKVQVWEHRWISWNYRSTLSANLWSLGKFRGTGTRGCRRLFLDGRNYHTATDYKQLKTMIIDETETTLQIFKFLHSTSDFRGICDCSLMVILTNVIRMGIFLHCQPPAPVMYAVITILERDEMVLKMLLWVGYLRWKFRLVPPGLWSMTSDDMTVLHMGNDTVIFGGGGYWLFDRGKWCDSILWLSDSKSWNYTSTSHVAYRASQVFTNLLPVFKFWVPQK
ncbi:uncharacterized protein LOC113358025 [Papaver somniferum]|uniref:uncharacterized protein LOC113358025 n=1 Tax=Papaver somniferum TaxID=3469 RepID=UPI000E6FD232|nr:uncharacterized protein LOC113358025 [Papaver somniferum]